MKKILLTAKNKISEVRDHVALLEHLLDEMNSIEKVVEAQIRKTYED